MGAILLYALRNTLVFKLHAEIIHSDVSRRIGKLMRHIHSPETVLSEHFQLN